MTRTVEEALRNLVNTVTAFGQQVAIGEPQYLAGRQPWPREVRDALLDGARALASSPPPAAPARDDRGADGLDPETWARAIEAAAGLAEDSPGLLSTPAQKRLASQIRRLTPRAASSSGEATALRREGWNAGITAAAEACDGRASAHLLASEPQREARKCANTIRSLVAAPSQETDAYRCSCRCHSEGRTCGWCAKRDPAPAPSAAPDTRCPTCGGPGGYVEVDGLSVPRCCASPGAGGADAKEAKP
jgi:hypothetical protein